MPETPETAVALARQAIESRHSDRTHARALLGAALAKNDQYEPPGVGSPEWSTTTVSGCSA